MHRVEEKLTGRKKTPNIAKPCISMHFGNMVQMSTKRHSALGIIMPKGFSAVFSLFFVGWRLATEQSAFAIACFTSPTVAPVGPLSYTTRNIAHKAVGN